MEHITSALKSQGFAGDVDSKPETLEFYSHDASLFEIKPSLVVAPKDSGDVQKLISLVTTLKKAQS